MMLLEYFCQGWISPCFEQLSGIAIIAGSARIEKLVSREFTGKPTARSPACGDRRDMFVLGLLIKRRISGSAAKIGFALAFRWPRNRHPPGPPDLPRTAAAGIFRLAVP